jgi:spoIIIJ-associated protein
MSAYQEFTGKTVEEAIRLAREEFGVELNDLDFEILTPGSRGVLGMGAEPARIVAAPRAALGGAAEDVLERPVEAPEELEDRGVGAGLALEAGGLVAARQAGVDLPVRRQEHLGGGGRRQRQGQCRYQGGGESHEDRHRPTLTSA